MPVVTVVYLRLPGLTGQGGILLRHSGSDRRLSRQDRNGCRPAESAQCAELLRFAADGAPEAYIQLTPGLITEVGEVTDKGTEQFLRDFIEAFEVFVTRVLTALPPERVRATGDDGAGPRT